MSLRPCETLTSCFARIWSWNMNESKCDLCNFTKAKTLYKASTKAVINSHVRSLYKEYRPWQCVHPGSDYKTKAKQQLQRHSRSYELTPELWNPFNCTSKGCGFWAARKAELDSHIFPRHAANRSKDFSCVMCPSKFYSRPELNKHTRSHVKEKVFECNYCNFKCPFGPGLRKHVRNVHEKSVTHKCSEPGCNFSSNFKPSLKKHLKRHNPDPLARRPFPCTFPDCTYRATARSDLKMHVKHWHNPNHVKEFTC